MDHRWPHWQAGVCGVEGKMGAMKKTLLPEVRGECGKSGEEKKNRRGRGRNSRKTSHPEKLTSARNPKREKGR